MQCRSETKGVLGDLIIHSQPSEMRAVGFMGVGTAGIRVDHGCTGAERQSTGTCCCSSISRGKSPGRYLLATFCGNEWVVGVVVKGSVNHMALRLFSS